MAILTRRELIRTGVAGALVFALADCAHSATPGALPFADPDYDYKQLSSDDRVLIAAIAPAMLAGVLPQGEAGAHAIEMVVRGVDVAIAGLAPSPQAEVHQLFGLLEFGLTRALAAGIWSSWEDAGTPAIADFLSRWRYSGISMFRSGYQALHQLFMASWYGNDASWARIGYPGPPKIPA